MVKRGSPGVDVEKSPLQVELSDADAEKLQAISRDIARIELVLGPFVSLLQKFLFFI
jgi:hypothetical protein